MNLLMSEQIDGYGGNQENPRQYQGAKIASPFGSKGLQTSLHFEFLEINSCQMGSGSAIGSWGICRSNTSVQFNSQTTNLGDMNAAGTMSAWCGCRPRASNEIIGSDCKRPTSIDINDISPADGYLLSGVGNNDSAFLKIDFRFYQKHVNTGSHEGGNQRAGYFGGCATLVEARPEEKTTENQSSSRKEQTGFWAVGLRLIHLVILSHMPRNSIKAVR